MFETPTPSVWYLENLTIKWIGTLHVYQWCFIATTGRLAILAYQIHPYNLRYCRHYQCDYYAPLNPVIPSSTYTCIYNKLYGTVIIEVSVYPQWTIGIPLCMSNTIWEPLLRKVSTTYRNNGIRVITIIAIALYLMNNINVNFLKNIANRRAR